MQKDHGKKLTDDWRAMLSAHMPASADRCQLSGPWQSFDRGGTRKTTVTEAWTAGRGPSVRNLGSHVVWLDESAHACNCALPCAPVQQHCLQRARAEAEAVLHVRLTSS